MPSSVFPHRGRRFVFEETFDLLSKLMYNHIAKTIRRAKTMTIKNSQQIACSSTSGIDSTIRDNGVNIPEIKTSTINSSVTNPIVEAIMKATRDIVEGMRKAES